VLLLALSQEVVDLAYVVSAVLFVVGIKLLGSPRTARTGNVVSAVGMVIAVAFTLALPQVESYALIGGGVALGAFVGVVAARLVRMTAMPQMVAIFNGLGGAASALIGFAEFRRLAPDPGALPGDTLVASLFSTLLGALTFTGSVLAFAKLQELVSGRPVTLPGQHAVTALFLVAGVAAAVAAGVTERPAWAVAALAAGLLFGILLVLPIGGADMPVVIAFLNAFSGLSAVGAGFILDNTALIIAGTLVGASGTFLTVLMGRAMNRSLTNVLFAGVGAAPSAAAVDGREGQLVREISPEDAAVMLAYASHVVIVPGYGLAVAHAQHAARELADVLERRGIEVRYAIHPVAGRMPGHMNILLAEANVPYSKLLDLDDANRQLGRADVALVVGANDVVNPAARNDAGSPLYGMPILDVDGAGNVIFLKRSLNPGFAGVENALFYDSKTSMLFGDAKASVEKLISAVKAA
jgi:H+-translocating NAD(P) transhydrogenase subunit beta